MVIYFATSSDIKFAQYEAIFVDLGVELRRAASIASTLHEPQLEPADDESIIVSHPLRQAARFVQKSGHIPYMVEDTTLVIRHFSAPLTGAAGLPGADTKSWWRNLHTFGVLRLMQDAEDRSASFACQIGIYFGESTYRFFSAKLEGTIANEYRASQCAFDDLPRSNPHYFHSIFVPASDQRTLGELSGDEFAAVDYRRACAVQVAAAVYEMNLAREAQLKMQF